MTEAFEVGAALGADRAAVDPGTNLLVTGPPLAGKAARTRRALATDFGPDDGAVLATTTESAADAVADLRRRTGVDPAEGRLRGVDCMAAGTDDAAAVTGVSSPGDLTGIGMHLDRHVRRLTDRGYRPRVGVLSVSTLLLYADVRPVFRFLHVLTGRVSAVDGLGVFVMDAGTHDERVASALTSLFDRRIAVRAAAGTEAEAGPNDAGAERPTDD